MSCYRHRVDGRFQHHDRCGVTHRHNNVFALHKQLIRDDDAE